MVEDGEKPKESMLLKGMLKYEITWLPHTCWYVHLWLLYECTLAFEETGNRLNSGMGIYKYINIIPCI